MILLYKGLADEPRISKLKVISPTFGSTRIRTESSVFKIPPIYKRGLILPTELKQFNKMYIQLKTQRSDLAKNVCVSRIANSALLIRHELSGFKQ